MGFHFTRYTLTVLDSMEADHVFWWLENTYNADACTHVCDLSAVACRFAHVIRIIFTGIVVLPHK